MSNRFSRALTRAACIGAVVVTALGGQVGVGPAVARDIAAESGQVGYAGTGPPEDQSELIAAAKQSDAEGVAERDGISVEEAGLDLPKFNPQLE